MNRIFHLRQVKKSQNFDSFLFTILHTILQIIISTSNTGTPLFL